MRHAKSDWNSEAHSDFDRPLNKRGLKEAAKMGAWLKKQKIVPDRIVSSPATRAKETLFTVCEKAGLNTSAIIWDKRIYDAGLDELLEVIDDHAGKAGCMLLIGHNPGLDDLVNYLVKAGPLYNEAGKLMTTAAIAVLDFGDTGINGKRQSAKLLQLVRPKEI